MARRLVSNLRAAYRRWKVSRRFDIRVPSSVFIAPGVHFERNPDGFSVGGKLQIGQNVRICRGAIIAPYGGSITLEDNVYVGPYSVLYGHGGLRIGRNSMIAAHTVVVATNHGFDDRDIPIAQQPAKSIGIDIGADVWIGAGVKILDGVRIGDRCVVGAGAVVNKSIESDMIAVGVPAAVKGRRGRKAGGVDREDIG
jgi:acetyltransferase-like isoleucine patch superfamily enzyme